MQVHALNNGLRKSRKQDGSSSVVYGVVSRKIELKVVCLEEWAVMH